MSRRRLPKGRRRRYSQLSRRDKIALGFFVGVPTVIHIMFVWVPAISTIVLSFTEWDGLKLGTWKLIGFSNYWSVFTVFDNKFFPALFNNLILLVFLSGCSVIGVLFAYLLDKNIRGSAIYQSVLLHARRVVARGRRLHLEGRDVVAEPGHVQRDPRSHRPGRPDRLGRQRREDLHYSTCRASTRRSGCRRTSPRS